MKIYQKIFICFLLTSLNGSCSKDRLDLTNPNQVTAASYWNKAEDAEKGVTAIYDVLSTTNMHAAYMTFILDLCSDESRPSWVKTNQLPVLALFQGGTSQSAYINVWQSCYIGIYRCNLLLDKIGNISMDEEQKNLCKGQAYFFRAYFYYYLVALWRNVPLITTLVTDFDSYINGQAPEIDVYEQVVADFTKAKELLPWEYPDADASTGRATKGAAIGFLGKTYMLRACHLNESDKWAMAENELLQLIPDAGLGGNTNSPYRLFNSYGTDYEANCRANGNLKDENNYESIFEIQFDARYGSQNHSLYDAWAPYTSVSTKASLRGIFFAPLGFGWNDVFPSGFVEKIFQQEKDKDGNYDPRRGATMTFNRPGEMLYGQKFTDKYTTPADLNDYYWKKMVNVDTPGKTDEMDWHSSINTRIMRLAEIYLLLAECVNEQNRTGEAYAFVQKIRDRANMPELQTTKPGLDKLGMRYQLSTERVLELCVEGVRWIDLVRWDRYSKNTGENWFSMAEIMHGVARPLFVEGKHELLPIPQNEIDNNPKLVQNPGW